MRRITVYREDSTTTVVYQPVKHYWYEAGGRVLVISHVVGPRGEHDYAHWPMRRVAWFRDQKIRRDALGQWRTVPGSAIEVNDKSYSYDVNSAYPFNNGAPIRGGRVEDTRVVYRDGDSEYRIADDVGGKRAYDDIVEFVELAKKLDIRGPSATKLWLNVFRNNRALRAMSASEGAAVLVSLGVSKRLAAKYIDDVREPRLMHEPKKGSK